MMEMGFLAKRSRPQMPTYLLRQPADQRRTTYSVPKNTTSTISCQGGRALSTQWAATAGSHARFFPKDPHAAGLVPAYGAGGAYV